VPVPTRLGQKNRRAVYFEELAESMARLFMRYKEDRVKRETFQEFCCAAANGELAEFLAPPSITPSEAVESGS